MDCNPAVSSIHGILQARILEWVAISFSSITCVHTNKNTHWSQRKPFKMSVAYINLKKKANYEAHVKLILFWKIVYMCVCIYIYTHTYIYRDVSRRMVGNMWTLVISGLWNSRWFFTFSFLYSLNYLWVFLTHLQTQQSYIYIKCF